MKEPRNHAPARELNTEFFVHDVALVKSIAAGLGLLSFVDARGEGPGAIGTRRRQVSQSLKLQVAGRVDGQTRPSLRLCAHGVPEVTQTGWGWAVAKVLASHWCVCVCVCVRVCVRSVRVDEVRVDVLCVWMCQDPEQDVAAAPAGHQVRIAACLLLLVLPLFVRVPFPVFVAA